MIAGPLIASGSAKTNFNMARGGGRTRFVAAATVTPGAEEERRVRGPGLQLRRAWLRSPKRTALDGRSRFSHGRRPSSRGQLRSFDLIVDAGEFARIEPDAAACGALVDFDLFGIGKP